MRKIVAVAVICVAITLAVVVAYNIQMMHVSSWVEMIYPAEGSVVNINDLNFTVNLLTTPDSDSAVINFCWMPVGAGVAYESPDMPVTHTGTYSYTPPYEWKKSMMDYLDYEWKWWVEIWNFNTGEGYYASEKISFYITSNLTPPENEKPVAVINVYPPPAVWIPGEYHYPVGTTVYFDASASYDPDGYIVNYSWFWTGTFIPLGYGVNISYTFTQHGTYLIDLVVTDNGGRTDKATVKIVIPYVNPPTVVLHVYPKVAYVGETVVFDASESWDEDGIALYVFYPGDGERIEQTEPVATYAYSQAGDYTVKVTVWDNDGDWASATENVTILPVPSTGYVLTVDVQPEGAGEVVINPKKDAYDEGDVVTLTAVPSYGYKFSHWEGDAAGSNETITITMDSNKYIKAVFVREETKPVAIIGGGVAGITLLAVGMILWRRGII